MYKKLPLFGANIQIWLFCGFIRFDNYRKALFVSIMPLLTNICQFYNIYVMWGNFTELALGLFMTAIIFNSLVRIFIVIRNEDNFIKFLKEVANKYREMADCKDTEALQILNRIVKRTQLISNFSLIFGGLGGIATVAFPLFLNGRRLPFEVSMPGIDVTQSPFYEIIFMTEAFIVMPFIVVTYIPFTNLFISWLLFGIGLLQDLHKKLTNLRALNGKDEVELLRELKKCIKYHNKIISFRHNLENLVSLVSLMEFMIFSIMLCVLLFFMLVVDGLMLQLAAGIYIFSILYVIFLSYWHANEFSCESLKIAEAAYNVDWLNGSVEMRKCVLIMMARSQKALEISAGGIYPMSLEAFQALLNASYSYFTLLRGLNGK